MQQTALYTMHKLRADLAAARAAADTAKLALEAHCLTMASLQIGETLTIPQWGARPGFWADGHTGKRAIVERIQGNGNSSGAAEVYYHMRILRKDGTASAYRCTLVETL